jgi:lantibiotic modifying enzyme
MVALRAWSDASGEAGASDAADRLAPAIAAGAADGDPAGTYDIISGDAGTVIALLPEDPAVIAEGANRLVARLVAAAEHGPLGLQWVMQPGDAYWMPGFSHGTAGVAYALLLTGRALERPELVELAAEAGRSLIRLATTPDGWVLPNRFPSKSLPPPVSFGWCHGPAGTVRLFAALDEIVPQPAWQQAIAACLQALRDSGLPARRYPGFWDNVGRCCGTAGVGEALLDLHRTTGDPALLEWSAALADDVISYAITDGEGTRWSNVEHTAEPPDLPPEPGLMQGAAGIAGWLARLAAAQAGRAGPGVACF